MRTDTPVTIRRSDYSAPAWAVPETHLHVDLQPMTTRVSSRLVLARQAPGPLVLDGVDLTLVSIALDGRALDAQAYRIDGDTLRIESLPDRCELTIVTEISPDANTALEGLYRSSGNYCTQCEAQGFRKITWFPDRPDVLSVFSVTIDADKSSCPVLLSNGNLVGMDDLGAGRHRARWHDPFPKPSYLFALVAGDLAVLEDCFVTRSGREVALYIYVQSHNLDKCDYAMGALKRSMRWDEEVYGLEYDLERFMIVAVDDFNMGAMENKGLNIFNSRYVLASQETATDADFLGVESVIAHEYFHNWTGNRVTCRDWFQLSLKEGLTVFRDQEFSSDMHSREVKRIDDVRLLRAHQFAEDAGPMSHPVRPDSYIEINNFYTLTVYEKGAEVIRMLHTLLGAEAYRAGIDLYFERHDGQAVTCDDFVDAMADASGVSLAQFKHWYSTAGTPVVTVAEDYDAASGRYTLTLSQHTPDTPGQTDKPALHIPIRLGLLDAGGSAIELPFGRAESPGSVIVDLTEASQQFVVQGLDSAPVASVLRGFSAPVRLQHARDADELAFLMANDSDAFNRWEAGQRLASGVILAQLDDASTPIDARFPDAWGRLLEDDSLDPAYLAEALSLPSLDELSDGLERIDMAGLDRARESVRRALAERFKDLLMQRQAALWQAGQRDSDWLGGEAMGRRRLANQLLTALSALPPAVWCDTALAQYEQAGNMSDRIAALRLLCDHPELAAAPLAAFHERWQDQRLVIDKWFSLQATARHDGVVARARALTHHPDFDIANPNRVRALIGAFANGNPVHFHSPDGGGYALLRDYVLLLDQRNPQLAARLVSPLGRWRRFDAHQGRLMRETLESIAASESLSPDVYEWVSKSLAEM